MKKLSGFSLIEIMIVVAVVALLAAVALPSYQESVRKSNRGDAQGALWGLSAAMERFLTENNTYCGAADTTGTDGGGDCPTGDGSNDSGPPAIFSTNVPIDGGIPVYNLTISAVTSTSYTLTATRTGSMTNDPCGNFTLTNTGLQAQAAGTFTKDLDYCWR